MNTYLQAIADICKAARMLQATLPPPIVDPDQTPFEREESGEGDGDQDNGMDCLEMAVSVWHRVQPLQGEEYLKQVNAEALARAVKTAGA